MTRDSQGRFKKQRKIVQISGSSGVDFNGNIDERCFALCNDGSVWNLWFSYAEKTFKWERMPDIPQEGDE